MNAPERNQATSPLAGGFRLGSLRVDPKTGAVTGPGAAGTLDPKVMDVLLVLAEQAGEVVPREDLLTRLWPNVVVTDEVLSRCVYELRRQLSHAGGSDEFRTLIETLPKRGYRLHGEVVPLSPGGAAKRAPARALAWVAAAIIVSLVAIVGYRNFGHPEDPARPAVAARYSIAVLPFADMSETQDQAYLADGVAEEILDKLNQDTDLRVIARTSSFVFRGKNVDVAEIARKLEVTHLLEGSVRRSGDNLRVTAQLIATKDSSHVWSTTFDRRVGDLFAIQDEIAVAVATALRATLNLGRRGVSPARDFAAYDMVKQAEFLYYRRAPGDIDRSVELFEQALRLDPHDARVWADLAGAYAMQAWSLDPPSDLLRAKQGRAALRAVELDPSLGIANARLAQYYWEGGDEELARKHLDRAVELDPDEPLVLAYVARRAAESGDFDTAIVHQRRALLRDPMNSVIRHNLGVQLAAAGRQKEALATFRALKQINPDIDPNLSVEIPRLLVLLGRDEEAVSEAVRLPAGELRDHALAFLNRSDAHRKEADAALRRFEEHERAPRAEVAEHLLMDSVRLAENYAFRGLNAEAFETLEKRRAALMALREAQQYSRQFRIEVRSAPFLRPLQADARWAALLAESN